MFTHAGWLFLKNQGRTADALHLEVDTHLDAVGDLDEGNAAVHSVVLTVEGHCPFDLAYACPLAPVTVNVSVSGLDTPRIVKVPGISKVLGPVCTTLSE